MAKKKSPPKIGPRGGTTTRSKDGSLIKKVFWIGYEEHEALRRTAFEENLAETSIVRTALRRHLGLEKERGGEPGKP